MITQDYRASTRPLRFFTVQAVTATRIAACFIFATVGLLPECARLALGLAVFTAVSDLIDGWLARRWKVSSEAGASFDACADKAVSAASVLYAVAVGIPAFPCLVVLFRDLAVLSVRQIDVEGPPLLAPKRWVGGLTVTPVRVATLALLWCAVIEHPPPSAVVGCFWFSAVWSATSLCYSLNADWPRIRRAFEADCSSRNSLVEPAQSHSTQPPQKGRANHHAHDPE